MGQREKHFLLPTQAMGVTVVSLEARPQWLMSVILATWEAEIRRMEV
jgi:hypothetical protein